MNNNNTRYLPVAALTTFISRWTIKTRVVAKSSKSQVKGGSSLFHVDLVDEAGDAIRAKFWGESADKWHPVLKDGQVYVFSKGRILVANKRFSNIPHNYELSFDVNAEIELVEDDGQINTQKNYSIMCLRDIKNTNRDVPFIVDLLVYITNIGPSAQVSNRITNNQLYRRTITVVDSSEYTFDVTLWNQLAENEENLILNKVCVISNVQVKDWNSMRVGQSTKSSEINYHFKNKKADELSLWLENNAKFAILKNMRDTNGRAYNDEKKKYEQLEISKIKTQMEDNQAEGNYIINGRVRKIYYQTKEGELRISYAGCPKCKKKLTENENTFNCIICNEDFSQPFYRYMFGLRVCDYSDQLTVRLFHDQGLQFLKINSDEMQKMEKTPKIEEMFEWDLLYKEVQISLKSKADNFSGENRVNYIAMKVDYINYENAAVELLSKIKNFLLNKTSRTKKLKRDEMSEDEEIIQYNTKKEKTDSYFY